MSGDYTVSPENNFLLKVFVAITAQITQMGWVTKRPNPTVSNATIGVTIIITIAPITVE